MWQTADDARRGDFAPQLMYMEAMMRNYGVLAKSMAMASDKRPLIFTCLVANLRIRHRKPYQRLYYTRE